MSIVTASGTNQLHGAVYEFLRNSDLDARNFFDQGTIPQFQRNEFGGALGGPLKKNKLFLFGNYEGYRQHLGSERRHAGSRQRRARGLFAERQRTLQNVGVAPGVAPLLSCGRCKTVRNWEAESPRPSAIRCRPSARISAPRGWTTTSRDNDTLFARLHRGRQRATTPHRQSAEPVIEELREQVVSVQEQHVFSPTLLNTARVGFSRASYFFTGQTRWICRDGYPASPSARW